MQQAAETWIVQEDARLVGFTHLALMHNSHSPQLSSNHAFAELYRPLKFLQENDSRKF